MTQRGALLVEELPSVLKEHGHEVLQIKITLDDKVVESNLQEELVLGEAKFDPFMLMDAIDRCPAVTAFWSTLLIEVREYHRIAERSYKIISSRAKNLISRLIAAERSGKSTKTPSAAEIDATFSEFFLGDCTKEELAAEFSHDDLVDTPDEVFELYLELRKADADVSRLKGQVDKLEIVQSAWREKGFMLKAQADLLQTLMNQGQIVIPQRKIYEGW